jgi:hypothetical protein
MLIPGRKHAAMRKAGPAAIAKAGLTILSLVEVMELIIEKRGAAPDMSLPASGLKSARGYFS